ncbi:hypothetical protein FP803_04815, partial [Candidatus Woesearchaeota archaeon]|nr:hypothetical protein [Candidatus Woesearchaeota archaeon]
YLQNNSGKIKSGVKYGIILPTALAVGLSVAPKLQETINKIMPTAGTNISQAYAAELKQGLYLWGPQIEQFAEANKNTWIMGEEFKKVLTKEEMNEFSEFEKKLNEFIGYTGMTQKLLIDLDKLYAIKINPSTKTENGSIIYYIGNLEDKNSVRVGLGELEVDINKDFEEILKGAYKYNNLLEQIEAKAQTPEISLADKVKETKRDTISKIQEEKELQEQQNLEGYVSELLNIVNNRFQIIDLENSKRIPVEYNLYGVPKESLDDKLLEELNLFTDMKLSVEEMIVQNKKVFVYNIIDSDDLNDGNITKYLLLDGRTKALFDEKNKDDSYTIKIVKSKLGNNKIEPVMSDLILTSSLKKDYNLYRISDGETTFGFVLAPEKLAIEEILKEYKLVNGAILGSAFKPEKIEPVTPPIIPPIIPPVIPPVTPPEEPVTPPGPPVLIDEGGDDVTTTTPTPEPEQPVLIDEGGDDVTTNSKMGGK